MDRPIRSIAWKRPGDETTTDITDALDEALLSSTPHPDDDIDHPKGYALKLILKPESTDLATEIQEALMDVDPSTVTVRLEDVDRPMELPVSVSKVPYPGDQNVAEMGVKPEAHDRLHEHF